MKHFNNRSQAGLGLMEIIVAAGLATVVIGAVIISMQRMSSFSRKVESSTDLAAIRARLAESVSCTRTFQTAGLPLGNPCPAGGFINLLGGGGQMVVPAGGLVVGQWTVMAYCKSSDGSLDIRAAKLRPGVAPAVRDWRSNGATVNPANFLRDEMDSNAANASGTYSWNHPKARLFPAGGGGLCSNWFAGTPGGSCPANHYIANIDFNSNTVSCLPLPPTPPPCAAGHALRWDGSTFTCDANYEQRAQEWAQYATDTATVSATLVDTGSIYAGIANPAIRSWNATATCPSGFKAVGGAVRCSIASGGYLSFSQFSGPNAWFGQCCIVDVGLRTENSQVTVSCIRE